MFLPIIFTRTKFLDYRLIVAPYFLENNNIFSKVKDKIVSISSTDGYRGDLNGRRFHVLALEGTPYVILGIVTEEFAHRDIGNRPIRGYYGIVCKKSDVKDLDITNLNWQYLDDQYIKPIFETEDPKTNYLKSWIDLDKLSNNQMEFIDAPKIKTQVKFNCDSRYIRIIGNKLLNSPNGLKYLLSKAITNLEKVDKFELVVGINSLKHVKEIGSLNAVTCTLEEDKLYSLDLQEEKESDSFTKKITTGSVIAFLSLLAGSLMVRHFFCK